MSYFQGFELLNGMLKEQMLKLLPSSGRIENVINGLALTRYDTEISPGRCLYAPMVAYVVQGNKRSFYGDVKLNYGKGQCVVLGIDVPGIYQVESASHEDPFLSLSIRLNNEVISHLLPEFSDMAQNEQIEMSSAVELMEIDLELLDAFRRLVKLLDHPEQIPLFAPLIIQEVHYRILASQPGPLLRHFNTIGTKAWQIRCAISWLRDNFSQHFKIEDVALKANMSISTFNRYFKMATGLSPLQFNKHLRLHEAERLMLMENYDASSAAMAVGYESRSHFTRDYKRLFEYAPALDVRQKLSN